jgi:hypothetical protein
VELERAPLLEHLERPVPGPERRAVYHPFSSFSNSSS